MTIRRLHWYPWLAGLALLVVCLGGWLYFVHQPERPDGLVAAAESITKSSSTSSLTMDDAQREFIWDIEHHGLVLSRYGFSRISQALAQNDSEALMALTAPDFHGELLTPAREVRFMNKGLEAIRREGDETRPINLDTSMFCSQLLEFRRLFSVPPKVSMALMNLGPVRREEKTGSWAGTCQLRLWGESAPARPAEVVLWLRYQVLYPEESTLKIGGWLQKCTILQSFVSKSESPLFREVAKERGINRSQFHDNWEKGIKGTTTGGVYLWDYDRDGCLDILIVDLNCCVLYRGLPGGKFEDVTLEAGVPPRLLNPSGVHLVAACVDLDGDGWVDLFLDKKLFRNEAGRFRDVTHQSNLRLQGDVSGIAVADYDRDGKLDLYVARLTASRASSWLDGKGDGQGGNILLRNKGDWQFEDVTHKAGVSGGDRSSFTAIWLDVNQDGWPDLHVPNEFGPGLLLVNQRNGLFREQVLVNGPGDFGTMGSIAGDVDNDGHIDLYVANMYSKAGNRVISNVAAGTYPEQIMATMRTFVAGSQLHRNKGDGRFEQLGQAWHVAAVGWAYGPALVDLNNDGWLDIYATAGFVSQDRTKPDG